MLSTSCFPYLLNSHKSIVLHLTTSMKVDDCTDDDKYTEDTSSDNDYESIDATQWGNQQQQPIGWDALIDHAVKVKKGGLGSGDLHRKGTAYKPLPEEMILAQRLKKPVPDQQTKKRQRNGGSRRIDNRIVMKSTVKHPIPLEASKWASQSLVTVPFWESSIATRTTYTSTSDSSNLNRKLAMSESIMENASNNTSASSKPTESTTAASSAWSSDVLSSEPYCLQQSLTAPVPNNRITATSAYNSPVSVSTQTSPPSQHLTTHLTPPINIPPLESVLLLSFEAPSTPAPPTNTFSILEIIEEFNFNIKPPISSPNTTTTTPALSTKNSAVSLLDSPVVTPGTPNNATALPPPLTPTPFRWNSKSLFNHSQQQQPSNKKDAAKEKKN